MVAHSVYPLKGSVNNPVALNQNAIETRVENVWFCCRVERTELKRLSARRDGPALRHFGFSNTDLSCPLGNGHEHNVHDSDPADEK